MDLDKIYYPWLPNIHRFEQKFLGISMMSFMGGGVLALILFGVVSQTVGQMTGMILGAVVALIGFGLTVLCTTKLAAFHHMIFPLYLFRRWQARDEAPIHLPLILSSQSQEPVVVEDWDGQQEGVIE